MEPSGVIRYFLAFHARVIPEAPPTITTDTVHLKLVLFHSYVGQIMIYLTFYKHT